MNDRPDVLAVGTLGKSHGVRGELKLRADVNYVALLRTMADEAEPVTLRNPETGDEWEVTFTHVRGADTAPIVAIDGVEGREAAEEFRGANVCVPRELLPEPEPGEYYLADLTGCAVHDVATGTKIGHVARAENLPANVVLAIKLERGGTIYAPLIDDATPNVDIDARRIDVNCDFLDIDQEADA